MLKLETKLVWLGCAMAAITSPQEWELWNKAENAGKDTERLKEEEEREKKEVDEQKAKAPDSAPPWESPRKSKFPGWAGLIVGVVAGWMYSLWSM